MPQWISLPTEIVSNIFQQFKTKTITSPFYFGDTEIAIPTTDLLQLQLTCKSWSSIAQSIIYQCVVLKDISKVDKFKNTLIKSNTGVLVEKIFINFTVPPSERLSVLMFVKVTTRRCCNLKTFCSFGFISSKMLYIIKKARLCGFMTKLEVIPRLNPFSKKNNESKMIMYDETASQLQQTLREFVLYDLGKVLSKDRLLDFPNVNSVSFDFTKYTNVYTIDQQMKNHSPIEKVSILNRYKNNGAIADDTHTDVDLYTSSQTKWLFVSCSAYTSRFCNYMMRVFPNPENIFLQHYGYVCADQILLPATEAVRLFYYIMKIRFIDVHFHFSGTQNDLMLQLTDQNNTIQHLHLDYRSVDVVFNEPPSLLISDIKGSENQIIIGVSYLEGIPLTLPRTGLIEETGFNLVYLFIDMNLTNSEIEPALNIELDRNIHSTLSKILHHCPKLRDFCIDRTLLYDFGDGMCSEQKKRIYEKVKFTFITFGPLFLPCLSYHVSSISDIQLEYGSFIDRGQPSTTIKDFKVEYVDIHMPDTKFDRMAYSYSYADEVYLKLLKTGEDQPVCYYGENGHLEKCPLFLEPLSSKEPLEPGIFNDKKALCVSIKYVDIREITIKTNRTEYHLGFTL